MGGRADMPREKELDVQSSMWYVPRELLQTLGAGEVGRRAGVALCEQTSQRRGGTRNGGKVF